MQHFMLQSSKYYILQLLPDEEFWDNCVLPINKSSLFHKYQGTILAFENDQQIYVLEIYIREGWGLMKRSYV